MLKTGNWVTNKLNYRYRRRPISSKLNCWIEMSGVWTCSCRPVPSFEGNESLSTLVLCGSRTIRAEKRQYSRGSSEWDWSWTLVGRSMIINVIHSRWCFPVIELGSAVAWKPPLTGSSSWFQSKCGYLHNTYRAIYNTLGPFRPKESKLF